MYHLPSNTNEEEAVNFVFTQYLLQALEEVSKGEVYETGIDHLYCLCFSDEDLTEIVESRAMNMIDLLDRLITRFNHRGDKRCYVNAWHEWKQILRLKVAEEHHGVLWESALISGLINAVDTVLVDKEQTFEHVYNNLESYLVDALNCYGYEHGIDANKVVGFKKKFKALVKERNGGVLPE